MERRNTEWDEEDARKAVSAFSGLFKHLEASHPECMNKLSAGWRESYMRCGHRRLGRVVLGYSPEDANRERAPRA